MRDGETSPPERQEAWQNLIGLTQQAILDRQRCNGDCSRPLAFELDPILRKIGSRLAQVAKGLYLEELKPKGLYLEELKKGLYLEELKQRRRTASQ